MAQEQDSLASGRPVQFGAYVDYGKLLQSLDDNASKWEIGGEVIIARKWQLVAEYGTDMGCLPVDPGQHVPFSLIVR